MPSTTLSIRVDEAQKEKLEALAKSTGRSRSFLAADAISAYLDINEWQVSGVEAAIASIDHVGSVPHSEVKNWVASWTDAAPLPAAPKPRKR